MLDTPRLILRQWRASDRAPFAAMSADPEVMRHLGPLMDRAASDAIADRIAGQINRDGHGFWAVERKADGAFLGFCGVKVAEVGPLAGEPELGWRLARAHWGQGYAREGAEAARDWVFDALGKPLVFAMTVPANRASRGLMERIGLVRRPELDFDHPRLALDDPLRPHIIYTQTRKEWR